MFITTLNKIPDLTIALAHNQPLQQFIHAVKENKFVQCSDTEIKID